MRKTRLSAIKSRTEGIVRITGVVHMKNERLATIAQMCLDMDSIASIVKALAKEHEYKKENKKNESEQIDIARQADGGPRT